VILIVVAYLIFENTRPSHAYILFSININFISPGFLKIRACCNFTYFCPVSISFQKVPVPNELKNTLLEFEFLKYQTDVGALIASFLVFKFVFI